MDMSGTVTNDTAYTGAVCMSITVVGNTTDLSLSDPFCNTDQCLAFKAAHAASQAGASYAYQFHYGWFTTWYYAAVLAIAIVAHIFYLYRNRRPPHAPTKGRRSATPLSSKAIALARSVHYRSIGGVRAARCGVPALGMLTFLLFTCAFFLAMTFWDRPYYRDRRGYGSPPLAVRTGLMSTALTPIIVALSGKANLVTWLTGIGHERLNVLHRWASYLCLFLAVVHTVPFLVICVQRCGYDGLRAQFYKPGAFEYTGVPPLGILIGLCTLSIPWIRHRFYNIFYRIHIPMYVVYLGLMFWHAGNELDSWSYLWATLAVWLCSGLARIFYKWQTVFSMKRAWCYGFPSTLRALPGDMTCVSVLVPGDVRWKPGQHCFLRMPHLSALQNHPYTIANLASHSKSASDTHEMVFYVRAHIGLTRDLLHSVAEHTDRALPMHIDGPYSGTTPDMPALYQSLIFVAGGSGVSGCLPHILHAAERMRAGTSMTTRIHLVWMVRHQSHTHWVLDRLRAVHEMLGPETLQLDFYVTDSTLSEDSNDGCDSNSADDSPADHSLGKEVEVNENIVKEPSKSMAGTPQPPILDVGTLHSGRPYLPDLLPLLMTESHICVFGCGPESLRLDLGNAVAQAQRKVLRNEARVIALHTEKFGW